MTSADLSQVFLWWLLTQMLVFRAAFKGAALERHVTEKLKLSIELFANLG